MGKQGHGSRQKRRGSKAYWIVVVAVLGLAGVFLFGFYQRTAPTAATAVPVRISMSGFAPKEIRVKAGQPVQIELINMDNSAHTDGGGWHNFVVEQLGLNEKVAPTKRMVITLTPLQPGEYDFYCDICCGGKENPYMHGRLIVS
jgi:cytochrome c oxidase subunit 2